MYNFPVIWEENPNLKYRVVRDLISTLSGMSEWTLDMQVAGPHAPGMPRASSTTADLSGSRPGIFGLQIKTCPWIVPLFALRSFINAQLFPGIPYSPQDWERFFSFFSLFNLLTLEQSTTFTIFLQYIFFQWSLFLWAILAFQYVSAVCSGHFP